MNETKYRIVVVHPDQQHSFRTATTLKEAGYLEKYITSVYDRKKSITNFLKKFLKGTNLKKLEGHRCDKLADHEVLQFCELLSIFILFLSRIDKKKIIFNYLNEYRIKKFNKKVLRYLLSNSVNAVILYDTLSGDLVESIKKHSPSIKIIIDMSAPFYPHMSDVFTNDVKKNISHSKQLIKELTSYSHRNKLERSYKEIRYADAFLVASEFSRKSLEKYEVAISKIHICRYGIDISSIPVNINRNFNNTLKCIYVGNFNQKKGVRYFLDAIELLDGIDISFQFVGAFAQEEEWYKSHKDRHIFTGHVLKHKVYDYMNSADVIVFPSLADGFGFSVLEALACGVPAICSENAGISDLIVDRYNGFTVSSGNSQDIADKLIWFVNNRDKIEVMRENARQTALMYSWANYNKCLINSINEILR